MRARRLTGPLLGVVLCVSAEAAAAECAGPEVEVDAESSAAMPGVAGKVKSHLGDKGGADPCASVRVVSSGGTMLVVVTLKDGRSALRKVKSLDELLDAVDALVLVPTLASAPAVDPEPAPLAPTAVAPAPTADVAPSPKSESSDSRFELGLAATAAVTGGPGFVGFGLQGFAQLAHAPFLVGVAVGFTPVASALGESENHVHYDTNSFGLSALSGRRFRGDTFQVDLLGGFGLEARVQEARPSGEKPVRAASLQPRLVLAARLSDAGASKLRGYLGLEVAGWWPDRSQAIPEGLREFPYCSAMLSFGLQWAPS